MLCVSSHRAQKCLAHLGLRDDSELQLFGRFRHGALCPGYQVALSAGNKATFTRHALPPSQRECMAPDVAASAKQRMSLGCDRSGSNTYNHRPSLGQLGLQTIIQPQ